MPGSDVLGYPPNNFRRKHLEDYYLSVFGALDIGTPEFATFNDFLIDNQDRTYDDAKRLLFSYASSDIISDLKDISEEEKKLESQQEDYLTEELSKLEIGGMALDKMNRDKAEIERLKAENAELKKRPKKTTRKKAEPVPIIKPPTKLEQFEQQGTHGEDFDWLHKFIISDGLDDLAEASRLVELPDTKLSTEERGFLSGLIEQKRQEALVLHPRSEKEIFNKIEKQPTSQPKKIPEPGKVRTSKDIRESRTEKEKIESFQPVQIEFRVLNPSNAERFLQQYKRYIPEIIRNGIKAWFDQHPEIYTFPLTSPNLFNLGRAFGNLIERKRPDITKLRDRLAIEYITADPVYFIEYGFNQAVQLNPAFNFEAKYDYYKGLKTPNLPENSNEFKKEVVESARKLIFNA